MKETTLFTCGWGTESMLGTEYLEHSIITVKAMWCPWIETAVPTSSRDCLTTAMTLLPFLSHLVLLGWWVTYDNWQTGMDGRRGREGEFSLGKQTEQQQQQNIRKVKHWGEQHWGEKNHLKHCASHNTSDSNREMSGGNSKQSEMWDQLTSHWINVNLLDKKGKAMHIPSI